MSDTTDTKDDAPGSAPISSALASPVDKPMSDSHEHAMDLDDNTEGSPAKIFDTDSLSKLQKSDGKNEHGKRARKRESKAHRQRRTETNTKSWASEVEEDSDEAKRVEKKRVTKAERNKARRIRRAKLKAEVAADNSPEGLAAPAGVPGGNVGPKGKKSGPKVRDVTQNDNGRKMQSVEKSKEATAMSAVTAHHVDLATTGLVGYIAIESDYQAKGPIEDWIKATIDSLVKAKHQPEAVTAYIESAGSNTKHKKTPALLAYFARHDQLLAALGQITILGVDTKITEFRGGMSTTYAISIGTRYLQHQEVRVAFERQTQTVVECWGWRCHQGVKTEMLLKTAKPMGRNVDSVSMNGWNLKITRVGEKTCAGCGKAHDCFAQGTECPMFILGV